MAGLATSANQRPRTLCMDSAIFPRDPAGPVCGLQMGRDGRSRDILGETVERKDSTQTPSEEQGPPNTEHLTGENFYLGALGVRAKSEATCAPSRPSTCGSDDSAVKKRLRQALRLVQRTKAGMTQSSHQKRKGVAVRSGVQLENRNY